MFGIPNATDAFDANQAEPDSVDIRVLVEGFRRVGVLSGCDVTASTALTLAVAAGEVEVAGVRATVTAGSVTLGAADATNPRFDLVTVDGAGTKSIVAGTADSNPVFPALPADRVVLAAVYVTAGNTAITGGQIIDKRVILTAQSPFGGMSPVMRTGRFYGSGAVSGPATSTISAGTNTVRCVPFVPSRTTTFDQIGANVGVAVAAATLRLGIYRSLPTGLPGVLLLEGTADASTTGQKTVAINATLQAGVLYWLAYASSLPGVDLSSYSNSGTVASVGLGAATPNGAGDQYLAVSTTLGLFPDPFGTPSASGVGAAGIGLRVA